MVNSYSIYIILVYKTYFELFKIFKPGSEVAYLMMSIFIPYALQILLFTMRNNKLEVPFEETVGENQE